MSRSERLAGRLARARGGAVAIEAALFLSFLMIFAGAALDAGRYLQLTARVERVAASTADLVSRAGSVRDRAAFDATSATNDIGMFFELARASAQPASLDDGGGVVVSSITGGANGHAVNWTRSFGAGADPSTERLRGLPQLPVGVTFIVAEVFMPFDPFILDRENLLGRVGFERMIYRRAIYRPRYAALATLEPAN
jgi:Flp pilus assembly protein TadG